MIKRQVSSLTKDQIVKLLTSPFPQQNALERVQLSQRSHPVINFTGKVQVLDLSDPKACFSKNEGECSIGRYNESRPAIYPMELFQTKQEQRCIHMGIDLGAPIGTFVYAWADSVLEAQGPLPQWGDYGHSIVLKTDFAYENQKCVLWSLYGHLSASSLNNHKVGQKIKRGEVIGSLGSFDENGGWPPHLHFQLSWLKPTGHDMPGTVTRTDQQKGLWTFPDPRLVLGALY